MFHVVEIRKWEEVLSSRKSEVRNTPKYVIIGDANYYRYLSSEMLTSLRYIAGGSKRIINRFSNNARMFLPSF